jgi:hypothetical protein
MLHSSNNLLRGHNMLLLLPGSPRTQTAKLRLLQLHLHLCHC